MAEEGAATIEDYDFSGTTAGASDVFPSEAGQIKKGGYIMIKGRPCKVVNVSTSKTGKHGHAKANFTAIDIFNGKKVEDVVPTTHTTYVPNVNRSEYQLLDIEDGFLSLLTDGGETRDDLKLPDYPEGFDQEILKAFKDGKSLSISVLSACGIDQVIAYKVGDGGRKGGREGLFRIVMEGQSLQYIVNNHIFDLTEMRWEGGEGGGRNEKSGLAISCCGSSLFCSSCWFLVSLLRQEDA